MSFFDLCGHSKLTYLRVLKKQIRVVFIALISHYGRFTALYKLIWLFINWRIKSSKNLPRDHAVPGLCFKNCSEDEVVCLPPVNSGKNIVKHRLSSGGVSPNQRGWQRNNCLQGLNEKKGLFSKFILVTRQREGWGKKLCSVIQFHTQRHLTTADNIFS